MESQTTITIEAAARNFRQVLLAGIERLQAAGVENARLDAEVLLAHSLGIDKADLYLQLNARATTEQEEEFRELIRRRAEREPVAYITGRKEFWSLDFLVSSDVLIPRPETERLVEVALEYAKLSASQPKIVDLGTGSGAIAIAFAKELPEAKITAVEISAAALDVARRNSARHGIANRIQFLRGDFFAEAAGKFDVIVSNPPYISRQEWAALPPDIRDWEPQLALDGGSDGLDFYRQIIREAHRYLVPGGHIILEIGAGMARAVADLLNATDFYLSPLVYRDYAGKDRVIAATKRTNSTPKGPDRG
jgi:release factor glutamine methyltransferase